MIDRGARKAVAEAIRYYLSGSSTNFTLDEKLFCLKSSDAAIDAIRKQLWLIYDDLREHRHEGAWTISADQREIVIRIILFLKSDFEFQWPSVPSWYRITSAFIWLLTFGFGSRALDRRFEFRDIDNVWPFHSSEEVQVAKNDPKYLAAAT
jgi:hypothetical protein